MTVAKAKSSKQPDQRSGKAKLAATPRQTSQGGYGHKSRIAGAVDPQGSRRNTVNQKKSTTT